MKLFFLIFLVLFLTGCSADEIVKQDGNSEYEYVEICKLTDADKNTVQNNPTEIVFENEQQVYIIDNEGEYILSGDCEGQIQIDVQDKIVHLILENVEMQSENGPVIYVKSAAKVVITIPENSSCILMDSTYYDGYEESRSCIFSEDDLTINGKGSLQVYGNYKDAIRTKDILKVLDVNLDIRAKETGLRGNDGVLIQSANLNIQCEGTGIYTEKENKEMKGFVDIYKGTVDIISGEYGIDSAQNIYIRDCVADIFGTVQDITCFGEQYIEEGCLK